MFIREFLNGNGRWPGAAISHKSAANHSHTQKDTMPAYSRNGKNKSNSQTNPSLRKSANLRPQPCDWRRRERTHDFDGLLLDENERIAKLAQTESGFVKKVAPVDIYLR
jgi:hypothetical protein